MNTVQHRLLICWLLLIIAAAFMGTSHALFGLPFWLVGILVRPTGLAWASWRGLPPSWQAAVCVLILAFLTPLAITSLFPVPSLVQAQPWLQWVTGLPLIALTVAAERRLFRQAGQRTA